MESSTNGKNPPKRGRGRPPIHGQSYSREYLIWCGLKGRCVPARDRGGRYGKRGITVCERWEKFENFLADMGQAPLGMSIDRIDNNGNYEPGNCRWATSDQQANNVGCNRLVQHEGQTLTIAQYARAIGKTYSAVYWRLVRNTADPVPHRDADPYA